jgi:hypothetical protein
MARDLYQRNLRVRRNPKRNKWAWVTVEERRVLMHNMDEAHLLNAMRMVDRRLLSRRGREDFYVTLIPRLQTQLACLRRTLEKKRLQATVSRVVDDAQNRTRTQNATA